MLIYLDAHLFLLCFRFACSDGDFINVTSIFLVNLPFPLSGLAYGHWVLIASMSLVHSEGEDYWSRKPFILLKKLARIFCSLMVLLGRYRCYQGHRRFKEIYGLFYFWPFLPSHWICT
ncbi:uncharacterized protein LOC119336294 [Triticum dicoccoides]|uniref:uncharacterized protein LOC119336294 n=1 Tax=Triticum dicoccoides TaxID=85692 RepID=UPI001891993F|nr:uncharacterized protein LOC119336294 [Triticum dicoccoides]